MEVFIATTFYPTTIHATEQNDYEKYNYDSISMVVDGHFCFKFGKWILIRLILVVHIDMRKRSLSSFYEKGRYFFNWNLHNQPNENFYVGRKKVPFTMKTIILNVFLKFMWFTIWILLKTTNIRKNLVRVTAQIKCSSFKLILTIRKRNHIP